jgi:hypothetical protein
MSFQLGLIAESSPNLWIVLLEIRCSMDWSGCGKEEPSTCTFFTASVLTNLTCLGAFLTAHQETTVEMNVWRTE